MPPRPEHDTLLTEQFVAEVETNGLLREELAELSESLADLELAADDVGWRRMVVGAEQEFSRQGLAAITAVCRVNAVKNPLIRRALALRHAYVWGGAGTSISARAASAEGGQQDVNAVIQVFLDEPSNRRVLTGDQAAEEAGRALGTDGNLFFALFTAPKTGAVRVRSLPWDEVQDVITNPEDVSEPWFYVRTFHSARRTTLLGGATPGPVQTVLYPAVDYKPTQRPTTYLGAKVRWESPVVHVAVNRVHQGALFGTPDVYPALDWSRAYKEFLEDWARLMRSLSRFAWRATAKGSRAAKVAATNRKPAPLSPPDWQGHPAGATAVMSPDSTLEAIPKTGASLDSESGKPLAAMVAAALDVPVTMLLSDPGVSGARAVAKTLDEPLKLWAESRRSILTAAWQQILDHVIDSAALAPAGKLSGTQVTDEYGRQRIVLAGDVERTLEISWPDLQAADPVALVAAIVQAASTQTLPDLVVLRLLLQALGVGDVDEVLDDATDDQGRFVSPATSAGQVAVDAFNRGEDPAAAIGGGAP